MNTDRDWTTRAACRDEEPEWFFPYSIKDACIPKALAICKPCPVRAECLAYADATGSQFGIWGGLLRNRTTGQPGFLSSVRVPSRRKAGQ